jgi:hypothetical protein
MYIDFKKKQKKEKQKKKNKKKKNKNKRWLISHFLFLLECIGLV